MNRPLIILESPFRSKTKPEADGTYLIYLRRCLQHSWSIGEHPMASHAYYPFFLSESDPQQRAEGIAAGYFWWQFAQRVIFYSDYGMSPGMNAAFDRAAHHSKDTLVRMIGRNEEQEPSNV